MPPAKFFYSTGKGFSFPAALSYFKRFHPHPRPGPTRPRPRVDFLHVLHFGKGQVRARSLLNSFFDAHVISKHYRRIHLPRPGPTHCLSFRPVGVSGTQTALTPRPILD